MRRRPTNNQLRAMRDRWQRDYERLKGAFSGPIDWNTDGNSDVETVRNLLSAIAWIDAMIARQTPTGTGESRG